jgi:twinkle protein
VHELSLAIGGFFLETDTAELYQRIAGIIDGTTYHVPGQKVDTEQLWKTIESFAGQFHTYDSFGAADLDVIVGLMRYLAQAQDVRVFYIDNMSQLTDESRIRESVEETIKTLKSLADEIKVTIMVASHLASPDKGSHEEGEPVKLKHFYGSRKLAAWIDGAFGLERNTQAEDEDDKLTTKLRILKLRLAGRNVGKTLGYRYDKDTDSVRPHDLTSENDYGFDLEDGEEPF